MVSVHATTHPTILSVKQPESKTGLQTAGTIVALPNPVPCVHGDPGRELTIHPESPQHTVMSVYHENELPLQSVHVPEILPS